MKCPHYPGSLYVSLLTAKEKSVHCLYLAVPVKRVRLITFWCTSVGHEVYSFLSIPNPWRTSVEHISITLSSTFLNQNIYINSCLNTKYQKFRKKKLIYCNAKIPYKGEWKRLRIPKTPSQAFLIWRGCFLLPRSAGREESFVNLVLLFVT